VLSGRGLCDELITRPEESYRLCCVVVCDLETSRMDAPYIYIYDISRLRVNRSQDSIVIVVNSLRTGRPRNRGSVPGKVKFFSVLQHDIDLPF